MSVIDSPPLVDKFFVHQRLPLSGTSCHPRFLLADKVYHRNLAFIVTICRLVLVTCIWRAVVGKTQAMPVLVRVVLVQEALIGSVKAVTARGQSLQRPVCPHVWFQSHNTSVESIWPTNVWRGREGGVDVEQLVRRSQRNHIGIEEDNLAELYKSPDIDLCESVDQVAAVEEVQVRRVWVVYTIDWDDMVVQGLEDVRYKHASIYDMCKP